MQRFQRRRPPSQVPAERAAWLPKLADGRVLKLTHAIKPWRMAWCRGAKVALELPAGAIDRAGVQVGDHLVIER